MADLWQRGEPRFLHLPRAQERQEPAHRRHPASGRRILAVPREYPEQPLEQQLGNPRAPLPRAARCRRRHAAGDLRPVAEPRRRASAPGHPRTVGEFVHNYWPSRPKRSRARRADRPRGRLQPRFRRADAEAPRAEREGGRALKRSMPNCGAAETLGRGHADRRSTKSASAIRSKACATGSRRFTRRCSARARARAWAASSRFMGWTRSRRLIAEALEPPPRTCEGRRCFHETIGFDCE